MKHAFCFFLFLEILVIGCNPVSTSRRARVTGPPNFVVIFVDDMGYGDIEPFGSTANRTPQLNRMAEEGMKLTSFYAAPVCTPSRASLMTGSYPKRVGLDSTSWAGVLFPGEEKGIHAEEITVAEILKTRGYATACVGKWHLGDQPEYLPTRHGFDYFYGLPYSNDMIPEAPPHRNRNYPPLPLLQNDEVVQTVKLQDQHRLTASYTSHAVKFIEMHRDEPFFIYLPHSMVHVPLFAGERFQQVSRNADNPILGDTIEEIDWSVGRILDTIRLHGLARNTLVLFTSDNGPARGSAGPLRGRKGSTFEGGMREPTIAWRPGTIEPGSSFDGITSTMDVLPTLAALAGAELPTDRKIDGRDISAILRGEPGAQSPYEKFFYYSRADLRAVRSGEWKLHTTGELYNLDRDVSESLNLASQYPDIVERLLGYLDEARADLGDGDKYPGAGVRPAGWVDDPKFLLPRPGATKSEEAHAPIFRGQLVPDPAAISRPNW